MEKIQDSFQIADRTFSSRLFLGTGKYSSHSVMRESIVESRTEMVTVAMKRVSMEDTNDQMLQSIIRENVHVLPNTSGVRTAEEAVFAAKLAREAFGTSWLKLEIHPNPRHLLPDSIETLAATEKLAKEGFIVLPYCMADPILCRQLEDVGAAAVMPLAAPIGTNMGLRTIDFLTMIIEQSHVPVIVDAGLGSPSQAASAMELGATACLVNTAIATSPNPPMMASAFRISIEAGRKAFLAGLPIAEAYRFSHSSPTSPLTEFLN